MSKTYTFYYCSHNYPLGEAIAAVSTNIVKLYLLMGALPATPAETTSNLKNQFDLFVNFIFHNCRVSLHKQNKCFLVDKSIRSAKKQ